MYLIIKSFDWFLLDIILLAQISLDLIQSNKIWQSTIWFIQFKFDQVKYDQEKFVRVKCVRVKFDLVKFDQVKYDQLKYDQVKYDQVKFIINNTGMNLKVKRERLKNPDRFHFLQNLVMDTSVSRSGLPSLSVESLLELSSLLMMARQSSPLLRLCLKLILHSDINGKSTICIEINNNSRL